MPLQRILLDGSENGASSGAKINKGFDEIERKEYSVPGKGLSTEDFTTALKNKLVLHEGSHFKGTHPDLTQLTHFNPSPEPGSYAFLAPGVGLDITMAVWDNGQSKWEDIGTGGGGAGGTPLTASQIKSLYESNADTNAFTDAFLKALTGIVFDQLNTRTKFSQDVEIPTQTLSQDPNITGKDNRLITVANSYAMEAALKNFVDQHFMPLLDPDNPTLKMKVSPTGSAAQMQVLNNGHNVATMEWLKGTQEFVFNLADKDTGATKATFEVKSDGNAYIGGKQIAVNEFVMSDNGNIKDTLSIDATGIYHGTNVSNSPVTGPIMIMASKDALGNLGYFLMGTDQLLRTGGRTASGNTIKWASIAYKKSYTLEVGPGKEYADLTSAVDYIKSAGYGSFKMLLDAGDHNLYGYTLMSVHGDLTITHAKGSHVVSNIILGGNSIIVAGSESSITLKKLGVTRTSHSGGVKAKDGGFILLDTITLQDSGSSGAGISATGEGSVIAIRNKLDATKSTKGSMFEADRGSTIDTTEATELNITNTDTANNFPMVLLKDKATYDSSRIRNSFKGLTVVNYPYLFSTLGLLSTVILIHKVNSSTLKGVHMSNAKIKLYYDLYPVTGSDIANSQHGLGYTKDGYYLDGSCQISLRAKVVDGEMLLSSKGNIQMIPSYTAVKDQDLATVRTIREFRTTITHNIANHAKPTLAECKEVFKLLPHFDWKKDDDFYIKDSTGGKIVLVKYRGIPAGTEAAPGNFFYEVLSAAV